MLNRLLKLRQLVPEFLNAARYAAARGKLIEYFALISHLVMARMRGNNQAPDYLINGLPKRNNNSYFISSDIKYENGLDSTLIARLPGGDLEIRNVIDWGFTTDDQETSFALHRFGWLLNNYVNDEINGDDVIAIICDWINNVPCLSDAKGWDSYSVSERLVNWILLLENLPPSDLQKDYMVAILQSMSVQVDHLLHRLEYRGGDTNNHLINNARAFYIAGCYLDDEEVRAIGRAILDHESQYMFSASGFLREGSSHYQLLLARTFLEVVWFARKNDDHAFLRVIENRAKKTWHAASFFLQDRPFPVIGDLSPDFKPDFHFGIGVVGSLLFGEQSVAQKVTSNGWHSLFTSQDNCEDYNDVGPVSGLASYSDAGYYRYTNDSYTLYIYINPTGYVPGWSHGHADIGNFILYWKGRPTFVGTGRSSYQDTPDGRYGRSVCSHNAVAVDGREPCIVHGLNGVPAAMSKDYLQSPPFVNTVTQDGVLKITITYAGMARWIKNGEVRREFECWPEELIISDTIDGQGRHSLATYFQIADGYHPKNAGSRLILQSEDMVLSMDFSEGMQLEAIRGRQGHAPLGWCSSRYGELRPIHTMICRQYGDLPVTNRYHIAEQLFQTKEGD